MDVEAAEAADWKGAAEQAQVLDTAIVRNTQFLQATLAAWTAARSAEIRATKPSNP